MRKSSVLLDLKEDAHSIHVEVKKPSMRHMDEFIRLKCAPDLLALKLFPDAKEITESMAAFHAVRSYIEDVTQLGNPEISCIDVGSGGSPRTGALVAFRTRWQVWSVDPKLNRTSCCERLRCVKSRIEDFHLEVEDLLVVLAVHSHAPLKATLASLKAPRMLVIAIPCCVDLSLDTPPMVEYDDWAIWSPDRMVRVWRI